MRERDHPALPSDVELDAIYRDWRNNMGYLRNLEYALTDAAVRNVLEYIHSQGVVGYYPTGEPIVGLRLADWQALRAAVGLDKEGTP